MQLFKNHINVLLAPSGHCRLRNLNVELLEGPLSRNVDHIHLL